MPEGHDPPMLLSKRELPILIVNLVYIPVFTVIALSRTNYEFLLYVGVILVVAAWIIWKQRSVQFDRPILWGLTIWGLLHMAGGNIHVHGDVLYSLQLIPLVSEPFYILRYDQVVHTFGFGVVTLVGYHVLRSYLREPVQQWWALALLIVLIGSGVGAINEIVEFIAVLTVPETGVGGYHNTMLDLVFNLIGGLAAVAWITYQRRTAAATGAVRSCP